MPPIRSSPASSACSRPGSQPSGIRPPGLATPITIDLAPAPRACSGVIGASPARSEEHTSELQSLMRISYAVFCLKKKKKPHKLITDSSSQLLKNTPHHHT